MRKRSQLSAKRSRDNEHGSYLIVKEGAKGAWPYS
jgi:hypothetical protein